MQSLQFPQPPSLNQIINQSRTNKYGANHTKKIWTDKIAHLARSLTPIKGKCWVAVEWTYCRTNSDPDNALAGALKFSLDGLVQAGILEEDTVKHIASPLFFSYAKGKAGMIRILLFDDHDEHKKYILSKI
jgi:hypothetical protein